MSNDVFFFQLCQRLSDYGAHLHRVFASKPSVNLGNTPLGDPETGIAQWIGITTRGIVLFEEERFLLTSNFEVIKAFGSVFLYVISNSTYVF